MLEILMLMMLLSGCCFATYYDIRLRIIPNEISYSLIAMGLLFSGLTGNLESSFYAVLVMIPFLVALSALGGMGAGDVKLLFAAAVILGFEATLYLLPAVVLIGAIFALFWLLARHSHFKATVSPAKTEKAMPFAPTILAAVSAVMILPLSEWLAP